MLQYSPKITTDGLVMCLDPSQNKSYPTTDLPVKNGLGLWLDASDDTTFSYSSGTSVSQWRDKSGNNFHASQALSANQPSRSTTQNSRKTVNFDGTNDTVTIPNFVCNSEMSIFVVSNCGTSLFIEHSTDTNSNSGFYLGGQGTGMFAINRSPGIIYINNTNWLSGGYSIASAVNSTGLDMLAYKNGTQQSLTLDARASRSNSYITANLYIGSRGASSIWTAGPIAEIIIYNRKVSDTERNLIHTYLGQKWGIFNVDRRVFDLSGNGFDFIFNGANPRYNAKAFVSNFNTSTPYAVSSFGGQNLTSTILNLLYIDHTIEVAVNLKGFKAVKSFDNARDYEGAAAIVLWQGYHGGLYVDAATQKLTYLIWNATPDNVYIEYVLPNDLKDKILYITAKRQANVLSLFINGLLVAGPTSITTTVRSYSQINIGAAFQGDPSSGTLGSFVWAGQHEYHLLRMYSRALATSELISNYQSFKARFDNNIARENLVLDLDAGNTDSYAGSGATWYDVSGIGNNGTLTNGPTYSRTNDGNIVFDGTDDYVSIPSNNNFNNGNNITVEAWVLCTNWSSYTHPMIVAKGINVEWILWKSNDVGYVGKLGWRGVGTAYTTTSLPNNTWVQCVGSIGSAGQKVYLNGVLESTVGNTTFTSGNVNVTIAAGLVTGSPANLLGANVAITRIYNTQLTDAQVLQNYNATKGRFGL